MRIIFAALALSMVAVPAGAQDVKTLITSGKWTAYTYQESAKPVCYMESKPVKFEGSYKTRGEVLLQITNRPAEKTMDVVSVVAGYVYQPDSEVSIQVGSRKFAFFTLEERAWARDTQTDKAVVQSMTKGASMSVRGTSTRGTPTVDTYSLQGFAAAYKAINDKCKQ